MSKKIDKEALIIDYFTTAPLEGAKVLFNVLRQVMSSRMLAPQPRPSVTAPRAITMSKPASSASVTPAKGSSEAAKKAWKTRKANLAKKAKQQAQQQAQAAARAEAEPDGPGQFPGYEEPQS